jgi:hypothetical protein
MSAPAPPPRASPARVLLAAAVAALVAAVVLALHAADPRHGPRVYLPAALAALLVAALGATGARRRPALVAGALAFALFVGNDRRLNSGDTRPAALLPYAVLRHGTAALDAFTRPPLPYWAIEREGRVVSRYPVAAALLAAPVYLPAALGPGAPDYPPAEKLAASLLAAASVACVAAALRRLAVPAAAWVTATALYAAGSPALTTTSQALWQHAPGALGVAGAACFALGARRARRDAVLAGLFAGLAIAARPPNLLAVAPLAAWVAAGGLGPALRLAAGAAPPLALAAAYQAWAFGAPWRSGYETMPAGFHGDALAGLAGLLASPARGLLPYVPWAALALAGLAAGARRERFHAAALAGVLATAALYARWDPWWGGWCYGPRFFADAMPLVTLGLAPLLARPRRAVAAALAVAGALAIALHVAGAYASRRAPVAAAADVRTAAEAWEWRRWPPAGWIAGAPATR